MTKLKYEYFDDLLPQLEQHQDREELLESGLTEDEVMAILYFYDYYPEVKKKDDILN